MKTHSKIKFDADHALMVAVDENRRIILSPGTSDNGYKAWYLQFENDLNTVDEPIRFGLYDDSMTALVRLHSEWLKRMDQNEQPTLL